MRKIFYVALGMGIAFAAMLVSPKTLDRVLQFRYLTGQALPRFNEGSESLHRNLEVEDLATLYPWAILRDGGPERPIIALTFDDGPDDKYTPRILDILGRYGVRATFFLIGTKARAYPEVVRRIVREGHAIGSHSYYHGKISAMLPQQIRLELKLADNTFYQLVKQRPRIFRPPYGALDPQSVETISAEGYKIVLWTVDSLDWLSLPKVQILDNIFPAIRNGVIVLQHSAGETTQDLSGTVEALPDIITTLQARGFSFTTIPEIGS